MIRNLIPLLIFAWVSDGAQAQSIDERAAKRLQQNPEADLNRDGTLTREEWAEFRRGDRESNQNQTGRSADSQGGIRRYRVEDMAKVYEAHEFHGMPYRFLKPTIDADRRDPSAQYPLILSLHGAGGRGDDNLKNLKPWNGVMMEAEFQRKYPCFVVAPQSTQAWRVPGSRSEWNETSIDELPDAWKSFVRGRRGFYEDRPGEVLDKVFLLLDQIATEFPIDPDRVYVLGHSMGGFGTFEAIAEQPDRFAAAIPSAGGLSPWKDADDFKHVPVWAFHGDEDKTVPFGMSQLVFESLKKRNGNMKLTTLRGVGHGASAFAFVYTGDQMGEGFSTQLTGPNCDPTSDVWQWLFKQRRAAQK